MKTSLMVGLRMASSSPSVLSGAPTLSRVFKHKMTNQRVCTFYVMQIIYPIHNDVLFYSASVGTNWGEFNFKEVLYKICSYWLLVFLEDGPHH